MSSELTLDHSVKAITTGPAPKRRALAILDAAVPQPDLLLAGVDPDIAIARTCPHAADPVGNALTGTATPVNELHLVSHGAPGRLAIGGETLDGQELAKRGRHWRRNLAPGATILLYGCSAGRGGAGRSLVRKLARATGARVLASSTPTGAAVRGGDWKFDIATGPARPDSSAPASAFSRAHDIWPGLLTDITNTLDTGANSFRDAAGSTNIDFTGLTGAQTVTLASAVTLNSGANTSLLLSGGTTNLTIEGSDIALALSNNNLRIDGTGGPLTLTINSNITGSGLLRIGDGDGELTVVLGGTNSMVRTTGGVGNTAAPVSIRVQDGDTLSISNDAALGSGKLSLNDGTLAITGATTIDNEINLDNLISTINNSADVTISGAITGTGGLIKTGASTLTLTGTNVYQDTTTITNGNLTVTGAGTIDNTVTLSANATITNSANVTLSGVISGANNLTKAGASTLTLSGNNTYTGTTTVTNGILSVGADNNLGTGALTLNGGNFTVTGATTIDNAVTLSSNATITNSANVTLSGVISGANNLAKAGSSVLTLSGTNTYSGTVDVTGATLATDFGFTSANGNVFTLIDNDGADAVTGTFTGMAEGSSFTSGGRTFQISYTAGDGNDVVLTDVTPASSSSASNEDGILRGSSGNDILIDGNGAGTISALAGDDTLYGYDDKDTLYGGVGADLVYGNQADDLLYGNQGSDTLFGGQNADTIFGGQDADILYGNRGADVIYGNHGNDALYGGQEADTLYGGQGDDSLAGNGGNDLLHGNLGADVFVFTNGSGADTITDYSKAEGDALQIPTGTEVTSAATETGLTLTAGDVTVSLIGVSKIEDVSILFARARGMARRIANGRI